MTLTVVVCTYNAPRYLGLVLEGLALQEDRDFQVIVADDGSGPETAEVVARFRSSLALLHSWQEDDGFRLAASRNRAIAAASGSALSILDGDCIPSPRFAGDAKRLVARAGARPIYFQGHRVILDAEISARLASAEGLFSPAWILRHRRHLSNVANAFSHPWPILAHRRLKGVRGCNMLFRAEDLWRVNGFDEEFRGWGHEDRDIVARLFRAGVMRAEARGSLIVYHLHHAEQNRASAGENLERARAERPVEARRGLRALPVPNR